MFNWIYPYFCTFNQNFLLVLYQLENFSMYSQKMFPLLMTMMHVENNMKYRVKNDVNRHDKNDSYAYAKHVQKLIYVKY